MRLRTETLLIRAIFICFFFFFFVEEISLYASRQLHVAVVYLFNSNVFGFFATSNFPGTKPKGTITLHVNSYIADTCIVCDIQTRNLEQTGKLYNTQVEISLFSSCPCIYKNMHVRYQ